MPYAQNAFTGLFTIWLAAVSSLCLAESSRVSSQESPAGVATEIRFDERAFNAERARRQDLLLATVAGFDAYLMMRTTSAERETWREYLDWDAWAAPLLNGGGWKTDEMKRIAKRFFNAEDGFELPQIRNLRWALTNYIDIEEATRVARRNFSGPLPRSAGEANSPQLSGGRSTKLLRSALADEYDRRVELLTSTLGTDAAPNSADGFADVEAAAWWLAATAQAPELLEQARSQFLGPAIIGQVHRDLIDAKLAAFESNAQEVRPSRKRINRSWVTGTAIISSHTTASLPGVGSDARLIVKTIGTVEAPRNWSKANSVHVTTAAQSRFKAAAELYWDGEAFATTAPESSAVTHSTVCKIDAPRYFRHAATKQVYENRASNEAAAAEIVAQGTADSMQTSLDKAVEKLNQKSARFLTFLTQTGNNARRWTTRVDENAIRIGYQPQLTAALGSPPKEVPSLVGDEMLSISYHDAAFAGILGRQVAGAVWRDSNFAQMQRELTGGNTEELMIGLEPERWSAQWSWRLPLRILFTADGATVRYRFDRCEIDGKTYEPPFEVQTDYLVTAPRIGLTLQRRSPTRITPQEPDLPLPPEVHSFLTQKFRGYADEPFRLDGLQFPAGGELDNLSGFNPVDIQFEPHWVHVKYSNR